jgi:hypothetical protein
MSQLPKSWPAFQTLEPASRISAGLEPALDSAKSKPRASLEPADEPIPIPLELWDWSRFGCPHCYSADVDQPMLGFWRCNECGEHSGLERRAARSRPELIGWAIVVLGAAAIAAWAVWQWHSMVPR